MAASRKHGESIQTRLAQATAWHQQGRLSESIDAYRSILADAPEQHSVWLLLGMAELQAGRPERAAAALERAVQLNPNVPLAQFSFGNALQALNRHADAIDRYAQGLSLQASHPDAWFQRGVSLLVLGRLDEALASFTNTLALSPQHVGALSNAGETLRRLGRHAEALIRFGEALNFAPHHRDALLNRGATWLELKRPAEALADFEASLAHTPLDAITLNNYGNALEALGRSVDALAAFDRAIAIDGANGHAWLNRAHSLTAIGRYDEARDSVARACSIDPGFHEARWNDSLIKLRDGDFAQGWRAFESRWSVPKWIEPARHAHAPKWLGSDDLRGKRVLLWAEQGLGDTLQFCRFARDVAERGASVVLEVQPPLKALLAANFPDISVIARGETPPVFDYATPLMSLPLGLGQAVEPRPTLAYLRADAEASAQWAAMLPKAGGRIRIGVAMSGNPSHANDANRSMPARCLEPLARIADLHIVQKGLRESDAAVVARHPNMHDHGISLTHFGDTAALVSAMDLVVSVDTSIAHLAGALGKPVAILLPRHADWRWMHDRVDTPWYASARLFRQAAPGDWVGVIASVTSWLGASLPDVSTATPLSL